MQADLISYMGDDLRVANAARVSFDKESFWVPSTDPSHGGKTGELELIEQDKKLIKYLANHNHWTPFSHCMITLRETVPLFIARQRFKHTVGFTYNEVSRRYVDSAPTFYIPSELRGRAENKKQGSSGTVAESSTLVKRILQHYDNSIDLYNLLLNVGICPEQARMVLPQSMYTSYYVTGSLAAFARAYKLRSDEHAQKEIQDLAALWDNIVRPLYPISWSALVDEV